MIDNDNIIVFSEDNKSVTAENMSLLKRLFLWGPDKIEAVTVLLHFTAGELFGKYIQTVVGGNSKQIPQYFPMKEGHDGGEFVFIPQPK